MNVRVVATALWFLAGWTVAGTVVTIAVLPSPLALGAGLLAAAVIWWDPTGRRWATRAPQRRVRPVEDFVAELEQQAQRGVAGAGEQAQTRP